MSLPTSGQYTTGALRGPTHAPTLAPAYGIDVRYTAAAEASDARVVSCQFIDANGADIDYVVGVQQYLSSDSAGQTVVAATTALAAGTDGTILTEHTANAHWSAVSEADGDLDINITHGVGVATYYLNTILPDGRVKTSSAIAFA